MLPNDLPLNEPNGLPPGFSVPPVTIHSILFGNSQCEFGPCLGNSFGTGIGSIASLGDLPTDVLAQIMQYGKDLQICVEAVQDKADSQTMEALIHNAVEALKSVAEGTVSGAIIGCVITSEIGCVEGAAAGAASGAMTGWFEGIGKGLYGSYRDLRRVHNQTKQTLAKCGSNPLDLFP